MRPILFSISLNLLDRAMEFFLDKILKNQVHGLFLERVYEIELDTKTEYEGF